VRRWPFLIAGIVAVTTATGISLAARGGASPRALSPKTSARGQLIRRGRLVILTLPATTTCARPVHEAVARIVGLPGQSVAVRVGSLYVGGRRVDLHPYLEKVDADLPHVDFPAQHIPAHQYLVLGDALNPACDSRYLGPVPARLISHTASRRLQGLSGFEQGAATCSSFGGVELGALYGTESPRAIAHRVASRSAPLRRRQVMAGCLAGLRRHRLGRTKQPRRPVKEID
jgi:signal peptidase I